jgi:hypothetical protein
MVDESLQQLAGFVSPTLRYGLSHREVIQLVVHCFATLPTRFDAYQLQ